MTRLKIKFKAVKNTDEQGHARAVISNIAYYRHNLSKFKDGEVLWITVENQKTVRSIQQNNYYWLAIELIANHTGHSAEEIHQYIKETYVPKRQITLQGKVYNLTGSTSKLSKSDMVELMMSVRAFAGGLGIEIPDPIDVEAAPMWQE